MKTVCGARNTSKEFVCPSVDIDTIRREAAEACLAAIEQMVLVRGGGVDRKRMERDREVPATKDSGKGGDLKKWEPGTGKGQILFIAADFDKPLDDFDEKK